MTTTRPPWPKCRSPTRSHAPSRPPSRAEPEFALDPRDAHVRMAVEPPEPAEPGETFLRETPSAIERA
jgi:hypothetical protein